jgi:hypothetical protein
LVLSLELEPLPESDFDDESEELESEDPESGFDDESEESESDFDPSPSPPAFEEPFLA